jgi:hypothetical protein
MKSSFCWALLLFIAANCFLNKEDRQKGIAAATSRAQLFDYVGVERDTDFLYHAPNVVLIGSSLLIHPEWNVDRNLHLTEPWGKQTIISASSYHLAQGLDNELSRLGFEEPHVYSLAVGGALMSDDYLLLYHYLKNHPKPAVVVLDCAPRSFNDTGVTQPDSTPIFDYCFQLQDLPDLHKLYLKKFDAKVNYLCSRVFFTYHHRQWLSDVTQKHIASTLGNLQKGLCSISSQLASIDTGAQGVQSFRTNSVTASPDEVKFATSLHEYKDRYWCTSRERLGPQLRFLKLISQFCASKEIKLIVVNMPLSKENRQLLPKGFYTDFVTDVATVGSRAIFLNLSSQGDWPRTCYDDSVHLNEKGGVKLNHLLAATIMKRGLQPSLANSFEVVSGD